MVERLIGAPARGIRSPTTTRYFHRCQYSSHGDLYAASRVDDLEAVPEPIYLREIVDIKFGKRGAQGYSSLEEVKGDVVRVFTNALKYIDEVNVAIGFLAARADVICPTSKKRACWVKKTVQHLARALQPQGCVKTFVGFWHLPRTRILCLSL